MAGPTRKQTGLRSAGDLALSLAFAAAIVLPLAQQLARGEEGGEVAREFRRPAPKPELPFDAAGLRAYPRAFDAWYGDSFGMRATLIRWHNVAKMIGLGVTPTPELVLGADDWLFTTRDRAVEVYRGVHPFTERELGLWRRVLEDREQWLAERGMAYVFAIAPNKEAIYPERMPQRLDRVGATRLAQLEQHLEGSDFKMLDLTAALLEEKAAAAQLGQEVYFPLGTHWNDRGALRGYRDLIARVGESVPGVAPLPASAFTLTPTADQGDSWAGRLYMEDLLVQENEALSFERRARRVSPDGAINEVYELPDSDLPRAVLFHDSFAEHLRPVFAEHFSRLACFWVSDFDTAVVEREQPDIVIQLQVERALAAYRPSTSPLDTPERLAGVFAESATQLLATDPARLTALPGMGIRPSEEGFVLRSDGQGMLLLPELEVPEGTWPVVHLSIESPGETLLDLEFLTAGKREYSATARTSRARTA